MNYDVSEGNPFFPAAHMMNSSKGCPPATLNYKIHIRWPLLLSSTSAALTTFWWAAMKLIQKNQSTQNPAIAPDFGFCLLELWFFMKPKHAFN